MVLVRNHEVFLEPGARAMSHASETRTAFPLFCCSVPLAQDTVFRLYHHVEASSGCVDAFFSALCEAETVRAL